MTDWVKIDNGEINLTTFFEKLDECKTSKELITLIDSIDTDTYINLSCAATFSPDPKHKLLAELVSVVGRDLELGLLASLRQNLEWFHFIRHKGISFDATAFNNQMIFEAVKNRPVMVVETLVKNGAYTHTKDHSAMMLAAKAERHPVIRYLATIPPKYAPDYVVGPYHDDLSEVFHYACESRKYNLLQTVLQLMKKYVHNPKNNYEMIYKDEQILNAILAFDYKTIFDGAILLVLMLSDPNMSDSQAIIQLAKSTPSVYQDKDEITDIVSDKLTTDYYGNKTARELVIMGCCDNPRLFEEAYAHRNIPLLRLMLINYVDELSVSAYEKPYFDDSPEMAKLLEIAVKHDCPIIAKAALTLYDRNYDSKGTYHFYNPFIGPRLWERIWYNATHDFSYPESRNCPLDKIAKCASEWGSYQVSKVLEERLKENKAREDEAKAAEAIFAELSTKYPEDDDEETDDDDEETDDTDDDEDDTDDDTDEDD